MSEPTCPHCSAPELSKHIYACGAEGEFPYESDACSYIITLIQERERLRAVLRWLYYEMPLGTHKANNMHAAILRVLHE